MSNCRFFVLLTLASCVKPCFSLNMCEVYFRRPCKGMCDNNENQLAPDIYCDGSSTGSVCCVPTAKTPAPPKTGWAPWSDWGECIGTCDSAKQYRFRRCIAVPCEGEAREFKNCRLESCADSVTDPTSTASPEQYEWSEWSACSASCGNGIRIRTKLCTPSENCDNGIETKNETCTNGVCPEWNSWSPWSGCSTSCGPGISIRRRDCIESDKTVCPTQNKCKGDATQEKPCQKSACRDYKCGIPPPAPRIIGGASARSCQWPWMVHIKLPTTTYSSDKAVTTCSGVLVDKNSVITTASCANILETLKNHGEKASITVADFDLSTTNDVGVYFTDITTHPDYKEASQILEAGQLKPNDLAVIQLDEDIEMGPCKNYVCLPDDYRNVSFVDCIFAGWGLTRVDGDFSVVLQEAKTNLESPALCSSFYKWSRRYTSAVPFEENFLCGNLFADSARACTGDEGGMLVCPDWSSGQRQWTLIGLNKPEDCDAFEPNLFVSVTSKFKWIREIMAKND